MAKKDGGRKSAREPADALGLSAETTAGHGGETHQTTDAADRTLTTNQGVAIADNQNSLRDGARGPTLLEDFLFREKITHFDHERIPERVVHARGSAAHGYFQPYRSFAEWTSASFLQDPSKKTPVFARFSTVAGGAGSGDMPRDVRGFAVKFYTDEGNFDLVGNNIPVFFIQDAIKFPDLVHAVKMEPDRGYPQAATAHDTFWDFVSLMPESMHMITWIMSDRTIPRSLRMMEGFGVHTFRFVTREGKSTFVKFHFRPTIGAQSVVWDECVKINGADPDYQRRDLFEAIEKGQFPEWEFSVQLFDEAQAASFPFDVLDATKLIPEELVPLTPLGKLVLDRNPDNFFAETEQAAFHPGHVVPGIDFSNDPLLQGRLFSYLDTQLLRLGGANFHELPINRPRCPMRNFQRDGLRRMDIGKGRVAYDPSSLDASAPRENPRAGYISHATPPDGPKARVRAESFADHYSQARLFYRSMTDHEQRHMVSAFAFELGKVETVAVRKRMLGHLRIIDPALCASVESALGMEGEAEAIEPARPPIDMAPSAALSLIANAKETLAGRTVAVLVSDGVDGGLVDVLRAAIEDEGGALAVVAPKIGGVVTVDGTTLPADQALAGAPSVLFDAVVLAVSADGAAALAKSPAANDWVRDAYAHAKVIGYVDTAKTLLDQARVAPDDGVVDVSNGRASAFVAAAKKGRIWTREAKLG